MYLHVVVQHEQDFFWSAGVLDLHCNLQTWGVFCYFFLFFLFCYFHSFWAGASLAWLISPAALHMAQHHSSSLTHNLDMNELRSSPSTSMVIRPGNLLGICAITVYSHTCSYIGNVERAAHEAKDLSQLLTPWSRASVTFLLSLTTDPLRFWTVQSPSKSRMLCRWVPPCTTWNPSCFCSLCTNSTVSAQRVVLRLQNMQDCPEYFSNHTFLPPSNKDVKV